MAKTLSILKNNFSLKKLAIYMVRWQLSSPIIGVVMWFLIDSNPIETFGATVVANLIGSLIFFWIDLLTFSSGQLITQWEVVENNICYDCSIVGRGYRLALAPRYNKIRSMPKFRCEKCSIVKSEQLKRDGKI